MMGRSGWPFSLLLIVMILVSQLPHEAQAGGGPPCQQPIVSRYCSSTQVNLLTPQKGRAKTFLSQLLKAYRPELLTGQEGWSEKADVQGAILSFHEKYSIPEFAKIELGDFVREGEENPLLKEAFFTEPQCYAGGNFTNLARFYAGLEKSKLDREDIRYLALFRLLLVQDCTLDTEAYFESAEKKEIITSLKFGPGRGWFGYVEAVAFYHDGFFPDAAELFAIIARDEKDAGRTSGWLIETARYMEVLSLFHRGREGQDKVFVPAIFNSFTEAFLIDFPQSEYGKHVEDMSVGIWLHYDERERYYGRLIDKLSKSNILKEGAVELDKLDELTVNAVLSNIAEMAAYPIEHQNAYTLLSAILAQPESISELCAQKGSLTDEAPVDVSNYIEMTCEYLLEDKRPDASMFEETPLFIHAKAFEFQSYLKGGKLDEALKSLSTIVRAPYLALEDLYGMRSLQLEARLKQSNPVAFITEDSLPQGEKPLELSVLDALLYEQLSRYFLSPEQLKSSLDTTSNALLRFFLIRPHLDEAMVQEDWIAAEASSKLINWEQVRASKELEISEKLSQEISDYFDLQTSFAPLVQDPKDAKHLSGVGYFLYKNHIAPQCGYARTELIEQYLDNCRRGYVVPSSEGWRWEDGRTPSEIRAPINMFSEAFDSYRKRDGTQSEEARLLRIMIYCAKGANNVSYCLRWQGIPRVKFKAWFDDLNRNYAENEGVKYWYYDLPFFTGFAEKSDGFMEQVYWYKEDAYLGYLE